MCVSSKTETRLRSHLGAETVRAPTHSCDTQKQLIRKRYAKGIFWFQCESIVLRSFSPFLSAVYQALCLEELTLLDLSEKIAILYGITLQQITHVYRQTPSGIHILVSDEVRPLTWLKYPEKQIRVISICEKNGGQQKASTVLGGEELQGGNQLHPQFDKGYNHHL